MGPRRITLVLLSLVGVAGAFAATYDDSPLRKWLREFRIVATLHPRHLPHRYNLFELAHAAPVRPTAMAFGADGRLYVAEMEGLIHAYTIARGTLGYRAIADEEIRAVSDLPNHDDLGRIQPDVDGRLITGLVAAGTADAPVFYVSSSDPRIDHSKLDTNSGIVSRLERAGGRWQRTDLVRGLPRSRVDHASHGLALDGDRGLLYLAQGGNTNRGAPSEFFHDLPEYALAGAILEIDLKRLDRVPYDLPTLDDEDRPGTDDAGDPFGGNNGKNQAILSENGPVRIYASGFRNPYDLVLTDRGMYVTDNGANADFGGKPVVEKDGSVRNAPVEGGRMVPNGLHHVGAAGYYGGHPNPTRADVENRFNDSNPQSPVHDADPRQARAIAPRRGEGVIAVFRSTTDGLTTFDPGTGDPSGPDWLLAVGRAGSIQRIRLSEDGARVLRRGPMVRRIGLFPLDILAQDADEWPFPSTIWTCDFATDSIHIVEVQSDEPRKLAERLYDLYEHARLSLAKLVSY